MKATRPNSVSASGSSSVPGSASVPVSVSPELEVSMDGSLGEKGNDGDYGSLSSEELSSMEVDSSEAFVSSGQFKPFDEMNDRSSLFETSSLNSKQRLFLLKEIDRLKLEVYVATVKGIGVEEDSVEAKNLTAATLKLEKAKKSFNLLFSSETNLVPAETPFFQWKGHIFNKRMPVFLNVEDCLDHFERVLDAHRLSVEENWRRLVPARMSTGMARWYATQLQARRFLSWSDFRSEAIKKYGRNQADVKEEAREKLEKIIYKKNKSFDQFIEQFQELKNQAEIRDEDCLVRYLFKALPQELAQATKFYINNAADKDEINIDFAISKVLATYEALFKEKWMKEELNYSTSMFSHRSSHSSSSSSRRSRYNSSSSSQQKPFEKKNKLRCKYHPGLSNHSEKDCILAPELKVRIDKAYKKYGPKMQICYKCKTPNFKEGHDCKPSDLRKIGKEKKNIVPVAAEAEDDEMETDEDDESKMTFAALSLDDKNECKLEENDFEQPPKDLMKNNSLILPITLESKNCIVKTYFLLDTGASFSCISPALAVKLDVHNINKKSNFGIIKTCQKNNVVKRMGCTDEKIKLLTI